MKTLKLNDQKITDTFQYQVCENYEFALKMGIEDYSWKEEDVKEGVDKVSLKLESDEIIDTKLRCLYIDSGSVDYIYYL